MKFEFLKSKRGDTLLRVRFEAASNFKTEDSTWVPKEDEIEKIIEYMEILKEDNKKKRKKRIEEELREEIKIRE